MGVFRDSVAKDMFRVATGYQLNTKISWKRCRVCGEKALSHKETLDLHDTLSFVGKLANLISFQRTTSQLSSLFFLKKERFEWLEYECVFLKAFKE